MQPCLEKYDRYHVDKVLFLGESANDSTFLSIVSDTMLTLQSDLQDIVYEDTLYVAAKSAAEFAKRRARESWQDGSSESARMSCDDGMMSMLILYGTRVPFFDEDDLK